MPQVTSGVRRDDDGYLTAVYELLQIPELCRTPDLLMERVLDLQRKAAVAGYRAALESSGRDVLQRAIAAPPPIAGVIPPRPTARRAWVDVCFGCQTCGFNTERRHILNIDFDEDAAGVPDGSPAQSQTRNEGTK